MPILGNVIANADIRHRLGMATQEGLNVPQDFLFLGLGQGAENVIAHNRLETPPKTIEVNLIPVRVIVNPRVGIDIVALAATVVQHREANHFLTQQPASWYRLLASSNSSLVRVHVILCRDTYRNKSGGTT